MLRLFLLYNLLLLNLYACQGGYYTCVKKVKDAKVIKGNSLWIPVKNNKLLIYSKQTPNAKILKYDPFLSLYLVEDRKTFPYPFELNMRQQLGNAMVDNKRAQEIKIRKKQIGLNSLALYKEKLFSPAIVTSSCCSLEGIVTPKGVIDKDYIKRFLSQGSADYADIGVRVKDEAKFVIVSASNPYIKNNPLKKGDCIISFDSKRVKNASSFMKRVLFSKIGSKHVVKVKRADKIVSYKVTASKRYGGGALSDTFLESKGIYFDKTLHIVRLSKYFKDYGLVLGDKLMQVNGVRVTNQKELLRYIENFKDFSTLLFERKNFQFFVNIK